ncbi:MAG: hypothetical protein ACE5Q6_22245 [Dehalococcoidia bacterium]
MWQTTLGDRIKGYIEIAIVSLFMIAMAVGLGLGAAYGWRGLSGQAELQWEIAAISGSIGLLPYLIVAAKVWEVNLTVFGNRAQLGTRTTSQASDEQHFLPDS